MGPGRGIEERRQGEPLDEALEHGAAQPAGRAYRRGRQRIVPGQPGIQPAQQFGGVAPSGLGTLTFENDVSFTLNR